MIEDAREIPNKTRLDTTVCILGGGAVGITIARELVRSGIEVILVPGAGKRKELAIGTDIVEEPIRQARMSH